MCKFFSITVLLFCSIAMPVSAKKLYWYFPQSRTQHEFARDEFECINSVTVTSQPQAQQPTVVIQQNSGYGNNFSFINGSRPSTSFAGGLAQSLNHSIATMPRTYTDTNMYKLCMQAKGYVEGQKPPTKQEAEVQNQNYFDQVSRENKAKSDALLAANGDKPLVTTLPSGIQYKIIDEGFGAKPNPNSIVSFNFIGILSITGVEFANTFLNKNPVSGRLGEVASLPGMLDVMQLMSVGARWEILLPPEKAFGTGPESLRGGPGPNHPIYLDIKLISVQ